MGVSPDGAGLSPTVEPASSLDGSATSSPDANVDMLVGRSRAELAAMLPPLSGLIELYSETVRTAEDRYLKDRAFLATLMAQFARISHMIVRPAAEALEAQGMSAGTAKTAQPVEGEARQRGPQDAPVSSNLTDDEGGS